MKKLQIRKGVQAYEILKLIGYVKEYPRRNLKLLAGENQWVIRAVRKLVNEGYIKIGTIRKTRTLRLPKKGRQALVDAGVHFKMQISGVNQSGNVLSVERAHRIAEVITVCKRAGIKVYPEELAPEHLSGGPPSLWLSSALRAEAHLKDSKITSGYIGVLSIGNTGYIVYNTGRKLMFWPTAVEYQVQASIYTGYAKKVDRFLVFGEPNSIVTLNDKNGKRRSTLLPGIFQNENTQQIRVDNGMQHLHFIELSENGIRLLQLMQDEYWMQLTYFILSEEEIEGKPNDIVCDGKHADGRPILLLFDMDLVRLKMFISRITESGILAAKILCFDWQKESISKLIGDVAKIELDFYSFEQIEHAFYEEREAHTHEK